MGKEDTLVASLGIPCPIHIGRHGKDVTGLDMRALLLAAMYQYIVGSVK